MTGIFNKLVVVKWYDAVGESTRCHIDSLSECRLAVNVNVGWIVHRSDVRLVLAHGHSDSGEVDVFVIPLTCVIEETPIV